MDCNLIIAVHLVVVYGMEGLRWWYKLDDEHVYTGTNQNLKPYFSQCNIMKYTHSKYNNKPCLKSKSSLICINLDINPTLFNQKNLI